MPSYTTADIRNVALVGHANAGKTLLVESLLHRLGVIGHKGTIQRGDTVSDYDPMEKEHGHSLAATLVSADYQGKHLNLIDTPGFPDFIGPAMAILPAVETMAIVVNAQAGVEMITRRMMDIARARKLCCMIVINKIDADNVNLEQTVEQIQASFGTSCLPINLPCNGGKGIVDVFGKAEGDADFSSVEEAHSALLDRVVEVDEKLMEKYLEQGTVDPKELHEPFEKALREGHLVPICFTSAHSDVGIGELVDMIVNLAPSPLEGNPRPFIRGSGEAAKEFHATPDEKQHVIAHVFKVNVDPFVGRLGLFRIHQGRINKDSQLYINDSRKPLRVGHLFKVHGKEHKEIDAGIPGDICALAKVEEVVFDSVLHDSADDAGIHLKPLDFPRPMYGLAIEAKSRGDEQKIAKALSACSSEDPCFKVERNASTAEIVIRGLGELHLRMILEKMRTRYHAEVTTRPPKIAYRETVLASADGHHRHKKQTGGAGQFGEVYLRVEPLEQEHPNSLANGGDGLDFVDATFGGKPPKQYLPAIEKGVRHVMEGGAVAGYPMQDVRVSVTDGKHHDVDSKEIAFVTAGRKAFIDAVSKARPSVLEPLVNLEITVPEHNMGDIAGDLSGKRGRILGSDSIPGGMVVVRAIAPLAELSSYQSQLKSVTGGQGFYTMEFSHYDAVPGNIQAQIVAAYKPREEED
ncbi:MAG: elongation factor G [Phycisphaeraceae bacterium]|nr:elongation factor G [Phycisphaeraceae bacterium]